MKQINPAIPVLHERALRVSQTFLTSQAELIAILRDLDQLRGYLCFDCKSLFDYATRLLKLSPDVAYTLIALARKSQQVPELFEKIEAQEISISNAKLISPILNPTNQDEWLSQAQHLSKRDLERAIVEKFPKLAMHDQVKPVARGRVEVRAGLSDEVERKLRRVQDLLSQKLGHNATIEEAIEAMADFYIEAHDPVEKAKRADMRKENRAAQVSRTPPAMVKSFVPVQLREGEKLGRRLSAALRHQVNQRDHGQCTWQDPLSKRRCESRRYLDIHHLIPKAQGGKDELANCFTLCSGCHELAHFSGEMTKYQVSAKRENL